MKKKCFFLIFIFFIIPLIFNSISFADDISDDEIIDVNAELISNSSNKQYNQKIPEINSRACVVIDRNTNTILYNKLFWFKKLRRTHPWLSCPANPAKVNGTNIKACAKIIGITLAANNLTGIY